MCVENWRKIEDLYSTFFEGRIYIKQCDVQEQHRFSLMGSSRDYLSMILSDGERMFCVRQGEMLMLVEFENFAEILKKEK